MTMSIEVLRLAPGDDLRGALEAAMRRWQAEGKPARAGCVVSAVGSLSRAVLRHAAEPEGTLLVEALELITLSGTLGGGGLHLHASVADAEGRMRGGPPDAGLRGAHHRRNRRRAVAGLGLWA